MKPWSVRAGDRLQAEAHRPAHRIIAEVRQLIVRIAREIERWGAIRIVGELLALVFDVSARTVRRYRSQALRRPPSQSWR